MVQPRLQIFAITLFCLIFSCLGNAQEVEEEKQDMTGQNVGFEGGIHLGNFLPNQISGVTEIMGLGGVRAGYRVNKSAFAEAGFTTGNGNGVEWKNISASIRMDVPFENLVGVAFLGVDSNYYKGQNLGTRVIFGGHVGGGLMAALGGLTWFRTNMTFGLSPGTSLYIDFGFVFRFSGGGESGGGST